VKLFYCLILIFLVSCTTIKKEYVCGDRPCVDKKEFNEYFTKNLSIEIKTPQKKNNKFIDLVKLNTNSLNTNKNISTSKHDKKIKNNNEKRKLKAEKIRILEERKIKKAEEKLYAKKAKIKAKEEKQKIKLFKIENKVNKENNLKIDKKKQVKKIIDKPVVMKNNKKSKENKEFITRTSKTQNTNNICADINDCDINKIVEILSKKGKEKPFPNITLN